MSSAARSAARSAGPGYLVTLTIDRGVASFLVHPLAWDVAVEFARELRWLTPEWPTAPLVFPEEL